MAAVTSIDWAQLAELEPSELQNALLTLADERMDGLQDEAEVAAASSLPEPLLAIWVLNWLDYEVSQGSLLAYFFNSHGRFAAAAVEILKKVGADAMAEVLKEAMASLSESTPEWESRHAELDRAGEFAVVYPYRGLSNAKRLSALTEKYWEAAAADDWGEKLDDFLVAAVRRLSATQAS